MRTLYFSLSTIKLYSVTFMITGAGGGGASLSYNMFSIQIVTWFILYFAIKIRK